MAFVLISTFFRFFSLDTFFDLFSKISEFCIHAEINGYLPAYASFDFSLFRIPDKVFDEGIIFFNCEGKFEKAVGLMHLKFTKG